MVIRDISYHFVNLFSEKTILQLTQLIYSAQEETQLKCRNIEKINRCVSEIIESENSCAAIAIYQGSYVGCQIACSSTIIEEPFGIYLSDIAVLRNVRRNGVGSKLVKTLESNVSTKIIFADVIQDSWSHRMLSKGQYVETDTHTKNLHDNFIRMCKYTKDPL